MKKQQRQHRMALTLLFTALVLCFMLVTLLIVGAAIYGLVKLEILTGPNRSVPSAARIIIIFVLAALVTGAGMTFFLGKIPMRPINHLINQMNRLAAGDYRARISYHELLSKHPTVIEFTDSFNRMAEQLQSTEMLRSDFINNFSHEFKTPIPDFDAYFNPNLQSLDRHTSGQTDFLFIEVFFAPKFPPVYLSFCLCGSGCGSNAKTAAKLACRRTAVFIL